MTPTLPRGALFSWREVLFTPGSSRGLAIQEWAIQHAISERFTDSDLTPAIICCMADLPESLALALRLGADPERCDDSGWSPLHWCAQSSRPECAKVLLEAGADPDALDSSETSSPLHFAATSGCSSSAVLIVKAGGNMQRLERETLATPAHWASHDPAWLVAVGSPMPRPDGFGRGPLHWAVRHAKDEAQAIFACQEWIAQGASCGLRDSFGLAGSDAAELRSFHQCARLLQSKIDWIALQGCIEESAHAMEAQPTRL